MTSPTASRRSIRTLAAHRSSLLIAAYPVRPPTVTISAALLAAGFGGIAEAGRAGAGQQSGMRRRSKLRKDRGIRLRRCPPAEAVGKWTSYSDVG
jgi:hypothetical protein